jgi:hypothetical protein
MAGTPASLYEQRPYQFFVDYALRPDEHVYVADNFMSLSHFADVFIYL